MIPFSSVRLLCSWDRSAQQSMRRREHKEVSLAFQKEFPFVTIHIGKQFLILHLEYAFYNVLLHW